MKRTLAFLFVSALLTLSLTACGGNDMPAPTPNADGTTSDGATGTASRRTDNNAYDSGRLPPGDPITGGNYVGGMTAQSGRDTTRRTTADTLLRPATYEQMLRNAHVHDVDGYLKDGENAVTPGILH